MLSMRHVGLRSKAAAVFKHVKRPTTDGSWRDLDFTCTSLSIELFPVVEVQTVFHDWKHGLYPNKSARTRQTGDAR